MLTVARLSTTPIRGFALHHPSEVELGPHGVIGDRRYTMLSDDGRIFDGTKLGSLVQLRAEVAEVDGGERLTVELPSGEVVSEVVALGPARQVEIYGRRFTARPVLGPWNEALSAYAGRSLELVRSERLDGERDRNAVSIVSQASVEELARQGNDGRPVDARRFRMLIELAGADRPHQEDEWLGRELGIGEAVVRVTKLDPRCVITTQDPDTGARDFPTLHVIKAYRGLRDGHALDFGIYAEVVAPGRVALGDSVVLGRP
ncbi:MAG TPA: MOSC domain-containing protein [Candidatus Limnocylindria bacterium]|nr:MOSC domain-containing protein [Candidatus Limnocylindria bacterium]